MSYSLVVTTDPTAEPLTLAETKTYLRVDSSDEDDFILACIVAARQYCEAVCKRSFITQTMRWRQDEWPSGDALEFPRPIAQTTASPTVSYYPEGSTSATTFAATNYWLDTDSEPARLVLRNNAEWPTTVLRSAMGVEVTLTAGYGGSADVPDGIRLAMLSLIGHWYTNREAVVVGTISQAVELTVNALLSPHIVHYIA